MRLTIFTDYTLRILIYLGIHQYEDRLTTISNIATAYGISENHLMKIVHHLAKQGYVETTRGKGGGMRLARAPDKIRLGDVVRGAEGDFAIVQCFQKNNTACPIRSACALAEIMGRAMSAFFDELDGHTLADLLEPREKLITAFRNNTAER